MNAARRLDLGAAVTGAHWIGPTVLFSLGDGAVRTAAEAGAAARVEVHGGAILSACVHPDRRRLLTAGDDGRLCAVGEGGAITELLNAKGKWIDHVVASSVSGVIAAACGKQAIVLRGDNELHRFTYASTLGGLALDAKGRRLAASHYGGVSLRLALAADDKGVTLPWTGSHLSVTLSPNADYAVSAMQENVLHGWRIADKLDLQMTGYPSKTRSFSWSKNGRWLATSGADSAVIWPFVGKLGPQGKPPLALGERDALVTAVAFHPSEEVLALGFADGAAFIARLAEQTMTEIVGPGEGAVSALAWSGDGARLALGDEAGRGAVVRVG
jgi:WD40 repeat protein